MKRIQMPRRRTAANAAPNPFAAPAEREDLVDLERRRDQLRARVAELQWDLGGLAYEMAIRNRMRVDVLVRRAALLQNADAELGEVERLLAASEDGVVGACRSCGAVHSRGATFCWQCGQPLLTGATPPAETPVPTGG